MSGCGALRRWSLLVPLIAGAVAAFAQDDCKDVKSGLPFVSRRIVVTPRTLEQFDDVDRDAKANTFPGSDEEWNPIGTTGSFTVDSLTFDKETLFERYRLRYHVEFDPVFQADSGPDDPVFVDADPGIWGIHEIGAPEAWRNGTGSREIVAAVVDAGIRFDHDDLAENLWKTGPVTSEVNGVPLVCLDETLGYDAIAHDCEPELRDKHGTHMAGLIGARGNNGFATVGVNWDISLLNVAFLDDSNTGCGSRAAKSLEFLSRAKATGIASNLRVVNLSWSSTEKFDLLEKQLLRLAAQNVVIVASAGNANIVRTNTNISRRYPSGYTNVSTLIGVAATDRARKLAPISNHGNKTVHLAAPGVAVVTTDPTDGLPVDHTSGTSAAAAFVTGSVALLASQCPSLTALELKDILLRTATRECVLKRFVIGGRFLNLAAASRAAVEACGRKPQ